MRPRRRVEGMRIGTVSMESLQGEAHRLEPARGRRHGRRAGHCCHDHGFVSYTLLRPPGTEGDRSDSNTTARGPELEAHPLRRRRGRDSRHCGVFNFHTHYALFPAGSRGYGSLAPEADDRARPGVAVPVPGLLLADLGQRRRQLRSKTDAVARHVRRHRRHDSHGHGAISLAACGAEITPGVPHGHRGRRNDHGCLPGPAGRGRV